MGERKYDGSLEFPVTADYTMSREQMIVAGKYSEVGGHMDIFSVDGSGVVNASLGMFPVEGEFADTKEMYERVERRRGIRPATFAEICAFGAKYPDEQRGYVRRLMAMGSVGDRDLGTPYSPALYGTMNSRWMGIFAQSEMWTKHDFWIVAPK